MLILNLAFPFFWLEPLLLWMGICSHSHRPSVEWRLYRYLSVVLSHTDPFLLKDIRVPINLLLQRFLYRQILLWMFFSVQIRLEIWWPAPNLCSCWRVWAVKLSGSRAGGIWGSNSCFRHTKKIMWITGDQWWDFHDVVTFNAAGYAMLIYVCIFVLGSTRNISTWEAIAQAFASRSKRASPCVCHCWRYTWSGISMCCP